MNKIQKILVPVNFSERSTNSLKYAASLAEETSAELIVLHVFEKSWRDYRGSLTDHYATVEGWPMPPRAAMPIDRWLQEKALDLYHFVQRVVGSHSRITITRKVEMGNPVKEITRLAREERADLIVLALKGRSLECGR